jgi:hypothetical protein
MPEQAALAQVKRNAGTSLRKIAEANVGRVGNFVEFLVELTTFSPCLVI